MQHQPLTYCAFAALCLFLLSATDVIAAEKPRLPGIKGADDRAVLTLARDIGPVTPPLAILRLAENDLARYRAEGARFVQAGYSQDKAHILTVHDGGALLDLGAGTRLLFHDCDATRGDSGSPILLRQGDRYDLIGIHVATATVAGRSVGVSAAAYQATER